MPHLKPISSPSVFLFVVVAVFRLAETFRGHREMHLVLEARVLALREQLGVASDDVAQRLDPRPLGLGEIAEHMRVHELLDAGMSDAKPHALIVVADMRTDRAQAVMAGDA